MINWKLFIPLAMCPSISFAGQSTSTPNIILFLVDDMGWQDTSLPFWIEQTQLNRRYHTPNMERLAEQGMKFTQAYACPVSSPSRVSLMTGMNAAHHQVTNWTLEKNVSTDAKNPVLDFPSWNVNGLSPYEGIEHTVTATTLPELLRQAGYYTIHCGKAHFGAIGTPGADPLNLGFNVNIAGHAAGGPGSYLGLNEFGNQKPGPWGVPGLEEYHGHDIFLTEALTIKALKELDKVQDMKKPFFLYMSHYAVHIPFSADQRFIDKYQEQGLDEKEAQYAALIEGMDKSLGDIMNYLEENHLEENTIILFMSDNGGLSAHGRGDMLNTHNLPLASGKGSAYEGGIREPMIVKWPGVAQPSSSCDDYIIIEDYFPSLLEMAGVKNISTTQKVDGISFIPMLQQKIQSGKNQDRPLFWHYPNDWGVPGPGIGSFSSIRKGEWKLIYYHENNQFELFNIHQDIGEHADVSHSETKIVHRLAKELEEYLISVNAQMPSYKKDGKKVPLPYSFLRSSQTGNNHSTN